MAFVHILSVTSVRGYAVVNGNPMKRISREASESTPKRMRSARVQLKMSVENGGKSDGTTPVSDDDDEELQNDKGYVFREFAKVAAAACGIGLVLFFFDILISLLALSVGLVYALAVLFEVRGARSLINRTLKSGVSLFNVVRRSVQQGWRAIRREVRKGLED